MAYDRNPTWHDYPAVDTPITAAALENIESGLVAAAATADSAAESGGSPTDIYVAAPTGTNDHTLINAAIDTAKTAGQPARIVLSPGIYVCSAPLTSLVGTSGITLEGGGGGRVFQSLSRTEIRYTGTGSGVFIDARDASGFTVSGLRIVYSSNSFTGILIHAGGGAAAPSYSPRFKDCWLGSTDQSIKSATALHLGGVVEALLDGCIIYGANIGIDGSGAYSNAVTMIGGRFDRCQTAAVLNPQFQWEFFGVVFEPGCKVTTSGKNAEGLAFHGCGWWDSSSTFSWIEISGSGLSIAGGYWEPQGGANESLVKLYGAFDGVSITGLKAHAQGGTGAPKVLALGAGGSLTNLNFEGNSLGTCVDGIDAARAIGTITHTPKRAPNKVQAIGNSGTAQTLTLDPVSTLTLTGDCDLTLPTPASGHEYRIRLYVKQDATGSRLINWPSAVVWAGGTAPTLTTTADRTDVVEISTLDGGAMWVGQTIGLNLSAPPPPVVTLPTPVAVFDAQPLGLANNAAVSAWADTSGNSRNAAQATGGSQPTYITSAINSKAAVRFTGTQYLYTATQTIATLFPAGTYSVIAVAKPTLSSGTTSIVGLDDNNATRLFQVGVEWNSGSPQVNGFSFDSGGGAAGDAQPITTGSAHVVTYIRDAATVQVWVDGVSNGSTAIGTEKTTGSEELAIGSGGLQSGTSIAQGFQGDIAYIAIYPGVLTTAQRQYAESQLRTLYGTP